MFLFFIFDGCCCSIAILNLHLVVIVALWTKNQIKGNLNISVDYKAFKRLLSSITVYLGTVADERAISLRRPAPAYHSDWKWS